MSAPLRARPQVYEALGKLTYWTRRLEYETSVVLLALPDRGPDSARDLAINTSSEEALEALVERTRYVPKQRNENRLREFTNQVTEGLRKSNRVIDQLTAHDADAFAVTRRAGTDRDRKHDRRAALGAAKSWTKELVDLCVEARRIQTAIVKDNLQ
jgi:hypothetical protein